ncbi:MAG: hypothetical protein M5R40_02785 [Anaerolineae bacterium]|nr:hypothetical protein [Anaerolineae bacterium]
MVLKARKLRGIENRSMVCSEKELGLSDSHEGIILLDPDAPVGAPLQDVLGDVVFDIDLTPNLARCWGIVGVAREVAALTGQQLRYPPTAVHAEGPPIDGQVYLRIEAPELNPRFTLPRCSRPCRSNPRPTGCSAACSCAGCARSTTSWT